MPIFTNYGHVIVLPDAYWIFYLWCKFVKICNIQYWAEYWAAAWKDYKLQLYKLGIFPVSVSHVNGQKEIGAKNGNCRIKTKGSRNSEVCAVETCKMTKNILYHTAFIIFMSQKYTN